MAPVFSLLLAITTLVLPLARGGFGHPAVGLAALLRSAPDGRIVEARLSGGFRHSPMRAGATAPRHLSYQSSALLAASASAQQAALSDPSAARLHVWGLSQLFLGDYDGAVASLRAAAEDAGTDAKLFSDLAAALLARAYLLDRPEDLPLALEAAEHARSLGDGPEIRYNRALALEALHLDRLAIAEWEAFLAADSSSGWAEEARRRMQALQDKPLAMAWVPGQAVTKENAFRAREWLHSVAIPLWAHAVLEARPSAATGADVQDTADRLIRITGDAVFTAIGDEVRSFSGTQAQELARAHLAYSNGLNAVRAFQIAEMIANTDLACQRFARAHSAFAPVCEVEAAQMRFQERKYEQALFDVDRLLAVVQQARFKHGEARAWWLKGRLAMPLNHLGDAASYFRRARVLLEGVGEWNGAARMWHQEAESAYVTGRYSDSWRLREHGLALSAQVADTVGSFAAFSSSSILLLNESRYRAAATFSEASMAPWGEPPPAPMQLSALQTSLSAAVQVGNLERARSARNDIDAFLDARPLDQRLAGLGVDVQLSIASLADAEGQSQEAEDALTGVIERAGRDRAVTARTSALLARSDLRLRDNRLEDAATDLTDAIDLLARRGDTAAAGLRMADVGRARWIAAEMALDDPFSWTRLRLFDRSRTVFGRSTLEVPVDSSLSLERIPEGTALLAFVDTGARLGCWVLSRSGIAFERLSTSPAAVRQQTTRLALLADTGLPLDHNWTSTLAQLQSGLLAPLASRLEGVDRLIVVPDGVTRGVPFASFFSPTDFTGTHRTVVRVPSIAAALSGETTTPPRSGVLVVGDPAGRAEDELPGARREAEDIAEDYAHRPVTLLLGKDATVSNVRSHLAEAAIVHFAGHAVSDPSSPGRAYLQLAPDESHSDGHWLLKDLRAGEFSASQIVVLAACRTADGSYDPRDSTPTMAEAMLNAGAGAVVASLWPLPDEASRTLFVALHRELAAGASAETALSRLSQRLDPPGLANLAGLQVFTTVNVLRRQ